MAPCLAWNVLLAFGVLPAADADRKLTVTTAKWLPKVEAVAVYPVGAVEPGAEKPKPAATGKAGEAITLPGEGPFDVFVKPAGGVEVRAAGKLTVRPGEPHELKLADVFGVVEVFGDDLPRAERVVLTAPDDPGPGRKGHAPVQVATEYRVGMLVPEGTYAVWVKPASGARAMKVEDGLRVLAGRTVRVEK